MENYSVVGKRLPRTDGVVKAAGNAHYTPDLFLPGMLLGKILRSPYAHARIIHIDTAKAEKLMGVRAVITGRKDTIGAKYGAFLGFPELMDEHALAMEKVRYIGDEVAAVAAVDEDVAMEALDLICVEYEELPAVFDPEEAMKPEAPKIHDNVENNIAILVQLNFGHVEEGFKNSDYIKEDKFSTQPVTHCALETHSALADFDSSGKLSLWSSNQSPYYFRIDLAKTLGMPAGKIRVIAPYVGGGFGGKHEMLSLDFCASLLSKKSGKPVKIVYTREEELAATRQRHPVIIHLKTGVKRDGRLMAQECMSIVDNGAYNSHGPNVTGQVGASLAMIYRVPNVRAKGYLVYTNKPIGGAFRGYGNLQVRFASEMQLNKIAEDLAFDPVEMRVKNAVQPGDVTANKYRITSCAFTQCLEEAAAQVKWREKYGKLPLGKGIGIAAGAYVSGAKLFVPHDASSAFVKVNEDGTVTLLTGATDIGQGSTTTLAQIVAEEIGVRLEDMEVINADSSTTPMDLGSYASRVTFMAGNAARVAAIDAKRQILEIASELLEASSEDLEIKDRKVYVKGSPDKSLSFVEAVKECLLRKGMSVLGRGYYNPDTEPLNLQTGEGNCAPAYSFGAQTAEVDVDLETGKVNVREMVAAYDCGFAINPMAVEGQLEGAISGGLGQTLMEHLIRDKGQTMNASLLEYKIPTCIDTPEVGTILIEPIDPEGPFGAKGVGESPQVPPPPAIGYAIYKAIGNMIKDLPITPEKILEALESRKS